MGTSTRKHDCQIELPCSPERLFAILHTPSAIRQWWCSSRAIVIPKVGGFWAATWGESEDSPDYVSFAEIEAFEPPRLMKIGKFRYHARAEGPLPFDADLTTEFIVEPSPNGATLRIIQDGFPADPVADEFYAGCEIGWKNTLDGIKKFIESPIP